MLNFVCKEKYGTDDLVEIMRILRAECPWDREQTHASIRRNMLEEAYEAVEAIDAENADMLCEELGDVLLQVVFHAQMAEEAGRFALEDVADGICKKLILRHPHIFSDVTAETADEVLENWDEIKRASKGQATSAASMVSVAKTLPATWRAEKIQKKAAKAGFDFEKTGDALNKVEEEIHEVREAVAGRGDVEGEVGDLLFAAVNAARLAGIDPEDALHGTCDRFISRFRHIERAAAADGKTADRLSLAEMDAYWDAAKALERE